MKKWIVRGQVALVVAVAVVVYFYRARDGAPRPADRPAQPSTRSVETPAGPTQPPPAEPSVAPEAPTGPRGTIRGRAHLKDGSPVQATVTATPGEQDGQARTALCATDGSYTMEIAPGLWSLRAAAPDLASDPAMVRVEDRQTITWDFVMRATGDVVGSVTDADGAPVQGATVRCTEVTSTTDAKGAFRMTVASGPVHVFARSPGLAPASAQVEVPPRGEVRCDLSLGRPTRIAGRVTDKRGNPIEGAEVAAGTVGRQGYADNLDVVTDKDGRYELTDLCDEPHWLYARARGHLSEWKNEVAAGTGDADFALARGGTIAGRVVRKGDRAPIESPTVALRFVGRQRASWDEGDVDLSPGGAFRIEGIAPGRYIVLALAEGYATGESAPVTLKAEDVVEGVVVELGAGGSLRGTVLSASTRAPVQDVVVSRVAKSGSEDVEADPQSPKRTLIRTDAQGRFEMPHVPAGRQRILLVHEAYCPLEESLDVGEGETIDREFLLNEGGRLYGRVLGRGGRPVDGVAVGYGRMGGDEPQWARTDAEGRYELTHVPAGQWVVGCRGAEPDGTAVEGMRSVTLKEGESVQVDFGAPQGARLSGSVRRAGRALGNVSLEFLSLSGATGPAGRVNTDATGAYTLEGVAPGEYMVFIDDIARRVTVTAGMSDVRHDFDLPEGGVSGHVYDLATRAPIEGARVQVYRAGEARGGLAEVLARLAAMARSDAQGAYAVEGLDEERYVLEASFPGYATEVSREVVVAAGGRRDVVDFSLAAGAEIELTVFDARKTPIAGATVTLRDGATGTPLLIMETARMASDEKGRLGVDGLRAGEVVVAVHAEGRASWQQRVTVSAGQASAIEVILPGAGSLRVKAVDASGTPVADASLSLRDAAGQPVESAVTMAEFLSPSKWLTNAEGVLERGGLAPGRYTGEVVREARRGSFEADVVEGQAASVEVTLK